MENSILICICVAMIITTIVNFAKNGYSGLMKKKYENLLSMGLAFVLGLIAARAINMYMPYYLTVGGRIILGLGLGTGSTLFYDVRKIVQSWGSKVASKSK